MHRRQVGCVAFIILVFAAMIPRASAQVATGAPPFSSFGGGPFDAINLANMNVHLPIPVFSRAGRGIPFSYALQYDSSIWSPVLNQDGFKHWTPVPNWGWEDKVNPGMGLLTYKGGTNSFWGWVYYDRSRTKHVFAAMTVYRPGQNLPSTGTTTATDGSGYGLYASVSSRGQQGSTTIYTPHRETMVRPHQT